MSRCGNDVNEEDAEVEVGVERRNEAELANIKTFCPEDLYLLFITSFPRHILGNRLYDRHMCLQTGKGQSSIPTLLAEAACFVSFFEVSSGPCYLIVQDMHIDSIYIAISFEVKTRVENSFSAFYIKLFTEPSKIYTIVSYPFT